MLLDVYQFYRQSTDNNNLKVTPNTYTCIVDDDLSKTSWIVYVSKMSAPRTQVPRQLYSSVDVTLLNFNAPLSFFSNCRIQYFPQVQEAYS